MSAEIGNKQLLRRIADRLGILDVQVTPGGLSQRDVIPVVTVMDPWSDYTLLHDLEMHDQGVGGSVQLDIDLINTGAADINYAANISGSARVLQAWAVTTFDSAGATAFDGKNIRMRWWIENGKDNPEILVPIIVAQADYVVSSTQLEYFAFVWSYGTLPFLVPSGCVLKFELSNLDGVTVFPANTVVNGNMLAVAQRIGVEPPY